MIVEIMEITDEFNKKLKAISLEKIQMYQKLMQYRRELYAYERAKENKEYNFERLNPNDRYIKMAQSFFDNSNITIEECIQILEKETMEVRNLVDCYKNAIKQYYSENQKPLYTVRGRQHEILRNNNDEQQEERINRTNI